MDDHGIAVPTGRVHGHRLDSGQREGLPRLQVEEAAVLPALQGAFLDVHVPLRQRDLGVAADVVDGVHPLADAHQGNRPAVDDHPTGRTVDQLGPPTDPNAAPVAPPSEVSESAAAGPAPPGRESVAAEPFPFFENSGPVLRSSLSANASRRIPATAGTGDASATSWKKPSSRRRSATRVGTPRLSRKNRWSSSTGDTVEA